MPTPRPRSKAASTSRRPLLIVDGDSFAHRAYHALPKTIRREDDRGGGAIVGFANTLLRLYEEERPRAVMVGWDTLETPNFRAKLFPAYQSGRAFDEELLDQLRLLPELVAACGFLNAKGAGYEADDFLAAAVAREERRGGRALVATGDRDAFQLVSARTTVLYPERGGGLARIGPAEVRERYGVEPAQVPDFIALRGDPSDKIPGAPGIGPKTAASLLRNGGSLDAILASGRFPRQAEQLRLYRTLATMDARVPIPRIPDRKPTWETAAALTTAWGLDRLAERFTALAGGIEPQSGIAAPRSAKAARLAIATLNINNVNRRLPNLLAWLARDKPDIVCLQELKAEDGAFPEAELNKAGYAAVWCGQKTWNGVAILARDAEPILTRKSLPGDPADRQARYVEAAVRGIVVASLYVPNGNPAPGPKFDYKLAWLERLKAHAAELISLGVPAILVGDFNVMPTDLDVYRPERWTDDALFRPEVREAYRDLLAQGWTDALREMHPDARIFTFWAYYRNAFARDAGLRIDHLLLSPSLAPRLAGAGVARDVRGWENPSDHAPVWIELAARERTRRKTTK